MASQSTRRALFALPLAGVLAGCSYPSEEVTFEVSPEAMPAFVEALTSFVERYNYSGFDREDLFRVRLEGARSVVWLSQIEPGYFLAEVRERTDLWQVFVPDADIAKIAADFRASIERVDGVTIVRAS